MTIIPKRWLRRQGTPAEFERQVLLDDCPRLLADRWRKFAQQVGVGDELWSFSSPDDLFAKKLGCAGYAIVRNGEIRKTLVVLRS